MGDLSLDYPKTRSLFPVRTGDRSFSQPYQQNLTRPGSLTPLSMGDRFQSGKGEHNLLIKTSGEFSGTWMITRDNTLDGQITTTAPATNYLLNLNSHGNKFVGSYTGIDNDSRLCKY